MSNGTQPEPTPADNPTGPGQPAPKPETPAPEQPSQPKSAASAAPPPQSAAERTKAAIAAALAGIGSGGVAHDSFATAAPPESPSTTDEGKVFEVVRLRARLTYMEQENEQLKGEIDRLKAEPGDYQDRNLRLMAEMENLRRRAERERADIAKYAITRFARDVLTVADTSQRAIENVRKEPGVGDEPIKSILEGFELTERELQKILESHGVKRMDPLNSRFDPNQHQAMMEVERPDVPAGTVVQVFQPAYMIEDRVLRPAMVVVSRGGPKVAKAPAEGAAPDTAESAAPEAPPTDGSATGDPAQA